MSAKLTQLTSKTNKELEEIIEQAAHLLRSRGVSVTPGTPAYVVVDWLYQKQMQARIPAQTPTANLDF